MGATSSLRCHVANMRKVESQQSLRIKPRALAWLEQVGQCTTDAAQASEGPWLELVGQCTTDAAQASKGPWLEQVARSVHN